MFRHPKAKKEEKARDDKPRKKDQASEELKEVEEKLFSDVDLPKKKAPPAEDERLGLIPKEAQDRSRHDSPSADETDAGTDDGQAPPAPRRKEIVVQIDPRTIERIIFIAIIVLLLGLVIYFAATRTGTGGDTNRPDNTQETQSAPQDTTDTTEETAGAEDTAADTSDAVPEEETAPQPPEPKPKTPVREQTKPDERLSADEVEEEVPITGNVTVTITDVTTTTTSYGGKIKTISFIIDNGGDPFVAKAKIYIYDRTSRQDRTQAPTIKIFGMLDSGKRIISTVDAKAALFDDVTTEKTVLVKVFDEGENPGFANDRLMAKAETTVMIK